MATKATTDVGTLITRTPGVYSGRPCLAGTRYPVLEVAVHFNDGATAERIASEYELPLAQVYAAIACYLANKPAFDAELEEERRSYESALGEHVAARATA